MTIRGQGKAPEGREAPNAPAPVVDATSAGFENRVDARLPDAKHIQDTPDETPLQRRVSLFGSLLDTTHSEDLPIADVLDRIKVGAYREQIESMRSAADAAHAAWTNRNGQGPRSQAERDFDDLKRSLPAVTWSGTFGERKVAGLLEHSGLIVVDIDHVTDLDGLRESMTHDPYVVFSFRSPSYHGLKVGFRVEPHRHEKAFERLERYFLDCYGVMIDGACRDVSRLCFLSYDPDLFVNECADIFWVRPEATKQASALRRGGPITPTLVADMLSVISPHPDYHEWVRIISAVGSVLSEAEAIDVLSAWSPEDVVGEYQRKLSSPLSSISFGTLVYLAKKHGWRPRPAQTPTSEPLASPLQTRRTERANMVCTADVVARPTSWLWRGYVPMGHLTIAEGDPGIGKSTVVVCELPARLSVGGKMPGDPEPLPVTNTILLTAEDGIADTLVPRLMAAGAERKRIFVFESVREPNGERLADLSKDIELLREKIKELNVGLVVIDPLNAYLGQEIDSYKDASVRQVLTPLAQLAQECNVAIIGVRHWTKGTGGKAIHKGVGSIGFTAAARVLLQFAKDPEDPRSARRVLSVAKTNISHPAASIAYHLETARVETDGGVSFESSRVVWEGEVEFTADDLGGEPDSAEARGQFDEAHSFLEAFMIERDWEAPAAEIIRAAQAVGVSTATLNRAKKRLKLRSTHEAQPGETGFHWVWTRS